MMKRLAVEPVERRIAHTLRRLANKVGEPGDDGLVLNVHLTRQDIAEMAGTTVETTIRVLSQWRKSGLVQMSGGHMVIAQPDRLWAIAEKV